MDRVPSRVIVYYPRGSRTGGPEALHQLVSTLRGLGTEAYLTPIEGSQGAPPVAEYSQYDAPEIDEVIDADDVAVVVPEIYPQGLLKLRRAQRFCWWLSIDKSPAFDWRQQSSGGGGVARLRRRLRALKWLHLLRDLERGGVEHLAQSHYAWAFLYSQLGVVSSIVSDYTVLGAKDPSTRAPEISRQRSVVAYNPAKVGDFRAELQRVSGLSIDWLPIAGMSPSEVSNALRRSAIYLDLGYHPGKDRLPREAAIHGALTLVARRGAAVYTADVPIPLRHKIAVKGDMVANAAAVMARVLPNLETEVSHQDFYRNVIRAERDAFVLQVRDVFQEGILGLDMDIAGVKIPDIT